MTIANAQIECDAPLLDLESAGVRMSLREFRKIQHDDVDGFYRYELVRGVVVVTTPHSAQERGPNDLLGFLLRNHQALHPSGAAIDFTIYGQEIVTGTDTVRVADRVIWTGKSDVRDFAADVPSIVIDFVPAGRQHWLRDYDERRDEYFGIGVKEYWVVNRFLRQMTAYRNGTRTKIVKELQSYSTPLLSGFVLEIGALLACADKFSKKKKRK